jgi:hypothetical protein
MLERHNSLFRGSEANIFRVSSKLNWANPELAAILMRTQSRRTRPMAFGARVISFEKCRHVVGDRRENSYNLPAGRISVGISRKLPASIAPIKSDGWLLLHDWRPGNSPGEPAGTAIRHFRFSNRSPPDDRQPPPFRQWRAPRPFRRRHGG